MFPNNFESIHEINGWIKRTENNFNVETLRTYSSSGQKIIIVVEVREMKSSDKLIELSNIISQNTY